METHKTSLVISILILIFAIIHSGGAALRNKAESIMGARLWRLCFVCLSLPSAIILISYFLVHRYDGIRLWNLQGNNFVSETLVTHKSSDLKKVIKLKQNF